MSPDESGNVDERKAQRVPGHAKVSFFQTKLHITYSDHSVIFLCSRNANESGRLLQRRMCEGCSPTSAYGTEVRVFNDLGFHVYCISWPRWWQYRLHRWPARFDTALAAAGALADTETSPSSSKDSGALVSLLDRYDPSLHHCRCRM